MERNKRGQFKGKFRMKIVHYGAIAGALVAICGLIALGNGYVIGCNETVRDANSFPILQKQMNDLSQKIFRDSIVEAQKLDDITDSLFDHREILDYLMKRSNVNQIIFRGGE